MKLSALFRSLSFGELSNLSISGEGSGNIIEAGRPKVIEAVNAALKDMFGRVVLLEKELLIRSLDWKSLYYLRKEHAVMDPSTELKYIIDTPKNPFTGDLVKVLHVRNECGDILPLNDAEQWASVFTPHFDSLQLTHPGAGQVFSVGYQALHPVILDTMDSADAVLNQEIRIPPLFEEVLRLKVAYGIFSAMSGQEMSLKAQSLEVAYEGKFIEIDQKNLIGDSGQDTNVKIYQRGFP